MNTFIRDLFATIGLVTVVAYASIRIQMLLWRIQDGRNGYIYDWQDEEGDWHSTY